MHSRGRGMAAQSVASARWCEVRGDCAGSARWSWGEVDVDVCVLLLAAIVNSPYDIEGKIRALEAMTRALTHLSAKCSGRGPASECPILEGLDSEAFVDPK